MIANFFRSLEDEGVEYLLISGQAAVLYGAAVFSEDIDLWVRPAEENLAHFRSSLRKVEATYYKLTPPLTTFHAHAGHGFHFRFGPDEVFLDVMGVPPRSRAFADAAPAAVRMDTDWGLLPVIGIPDLIELKKTQRLEDYAVISRLVLEFLKRPEDETRRFDAWLKRPALAGSPAEIAAFRQRQIFDWAIENIFTLESLTQFLAQSGLDWDGYDGRYAREVRAWRAELEAPPGWSERTERAINSWMQRRIAEFQAEDRAYWKPVIRELKRLREEGQLMPLRRPA
jgi:hypothetical protein